MDDGLQTNEVRCGADLRLSTSITYLGDMNIFHSHIIRGHGKGLPLEHNTKAGNGGLCCFSSLDERVRILGGTNQLISEPSNGTVNDSRIPPPKNSSST